MRARTGGARGLIRAGGAAAVLGAGLASGLGAQEARAVEKNWAACADLAVWDAQERVRHDEPAAWFEFVTPYIQRGVCRFTRDGEGVRVVDRLTSPADHVVLSVSFGMKETWFLSPEALKP